MLTGSAAYVSVARASRRAAAVIASRRRTKDAKAAIEGVFGKSARAIEKSGRNAPRSRDQPLWTMRKTIPCARLVSGAGAAMTGAEGAEAVAGGVGVGVGASWHRKAVPANDWNQSWFWGYDVAGWSWRWRWGPDASPVIPTSPTAAPAAS